MKRIVCLLLSLVTAGLFLVSCGEHEWEDTSKYDDKIVDDTVDDISLDLFIIKGDETVENAEVTVQSKIKTHTASKYHTEVTVHYFTEAEYKAGLIAGLDEADIVLINSPELLFELVEDNKLAELSGLLELDQFGTLKATAKKLIEASKIVETVEVVDEITGETELRDVLSLYSIPNNRKIGEFEYLVIDKELAMHTLNYSPAALAAFTSYEDTKELRDDIVAYDATLDPTEYVSVVKGDFKLKAELEAQGKYCGIIANPVADQAEAFASAFAIIDRSAEVIAEVMEANKDDEELTEEALAELCTNAVTDWNCRVMEIIYALHNDVDLRNYLQYGINGTNYTHDTDGSLLLTDSEENIYRMNLIYTGDVFDAFFCEEIGWTAEELANADAQNKAAEVDAAVIEE